jgi:hypothetical protein
MEETDVYHLTPTIHALQQAIPNGCPAKALPPSQRLTIGVQALAGDRTITALAEEYEVSRKFVYGQAATARAALEDAFNPAAVSADEVLFHLPVTKNWLRQFVLGLTLHCHSSYRGVRAVLADCFDTSLSLGTVHNIVCAAVGSAQQVNASYDLASVRIGAHDEIFQNGQPVLVGVDVASTFCYLLSLEEHRDADTWGLRLLELQDQGLRPDATIADAGRGLRAGQTLAWPGTPCRGDVFHAEMDLSALVTFLDNRAYAAIDACDQQERRMARAKRRGRGHTHSKRLALLRQEQAAMVTLADEVSVLVGWLRDDIFAVAGPDHATRGQLFDFVVAALEARQTRCPHRIGPVVRALGNQRDDLLAFAAVLDQQLAALAHDFQVAPALVRELLLVDALQPRAATRWQRTAVLQRRLGSRYWALQEAVAMVAAQTVRASSVIENVNSRLRSYFFLRRHLGPDYLALLRFFLNHRRFPRSEHAERVGKSPAELLLGRSHPHWLELLGYRRFERN